MKELHVDVKKAIQGLQISTQRLVTTKMLGNYKSFFRGQGLEFENYRTYSASDDANRIDWKASIRGGEIVVKEFVEERNLEVFFLLDVSSSMMFGSHAKLKNEFAAELVAVLAYAAVEAGDSVGYAFFHDSLVDTRLPEQGKTQYYRFLRAVVQAEMYGGGYNLSGVIDTLLQQLSHSSVLIIVSDFIGADTALQRSLKLAGRKFDVVGIMVRDPRDRELPDINSNIAVQHPYTGEIRLINPHRVRNQYKLEARRQERSVENLFSDAKCDFISVETDKPFMKPLLKFFQYRGI